MKGNAMNKYSDKDDQFLVEMTLLGDEAAYEALVLRHQRAVMGTAYKVTGNRHSAEDASQDAFVSAWMNLSELRDGSKFGAWVCAFAKNCARTLERHYRAAIPSISLDAPGVPAPFEEDDLFAEDEYGNIHDAVDSLSEKIRETVKLHYFAGKSVAEIAEMLSVPVGTVKWRLSEGRKQLRKGYGIMEKTYDENESLVSRVMRQVEVLKLWQIRSEGNFEEEYRAILANVEALPESREKNALLADTLMRGYWWLPDKRSAEMLEKIKKVAENGHNEDVMMDLVAKEHDELSGDEKIKFMRETQIPYYRDNGYPRTLAYVWFWLGYEYRERGEYEEAIRCYGETLKLLTPSDVYYAFAKAAIEGEKRSIAASGNPKVLRCASCEVLKKIEEKLYFWSQPGYGYAVDGSLLWSMSFCEGIILDEKMKVGDTIMSSGGEITLTYRTDGDVCDTPAGHFENCSVYVLFNKQTGLTCCETWLCDGVGIVRQINTSSGNACEWVLSAYQTDGTGGLLPFAVGNRWKYVPAAPEAAGIGECENIFEVTACDNGSILLSHMDAMVLKDSGI